jgi:plastocyanin
MVSPGSYSRVVVLTIYHALALNSESVVLSSTSPPGINVSFSPSSPVELPADKNLNVTLNIVASPSATLSNDTITVQGVSGPTTRTASFTLRVVQYHVVMVQNTFIPATMNVSLGSTVYWQNFDGPAGGCGAASSGTGYHSVVFTTIPGANSSTIKQFGIYSYTFTTPGSYFYYSSLDSDHSMNGTINVMAAGGAGMGSASIIPAFSYFKEGSAASTATSAATTTAAGTATSPAAAGGLAITGLAALSEFSPPISALVFETSPAVLLGLVALVFASAMLASGKRTPSLLSRVLETDPGGRSLSRGELPSPRSSHAQLDLVVEGCDELPARRAGSSLSL